MMEDKERNSAEATKAEGSCPEKESALENNINHDIDILLDDGPDNKPKDEKLENSILVNENSDFYEKDEYVDNIQNFNSNDRRNPYYREFVPVQVRNSQKNFIPHGVISVYSLLTIIIPPVDGKTAAIHSKQPQEVIGSTIMLYWLIRSILPPLPLTTNAFTLSHWPTVGSTKLPFEIG